MLLSDIVHDSALKRPGHLALVIDEQAITYAELSSRVTRLARALASAIAPGDRVAVLADNCVEYIDLLYAAPESGAVLTLVNQRLTVPEVEYILGSAEPRILFVGASHVERLGDLPRRAGVEQVVVIDGEAPSASALDYERFCATGAPAPDVRPSPDDTAWLIFTSGTTGRPKGAMLSHRNVVSGILNAILEWHATRDDRFLYNYPLCHVAAFMPLGYHLRQATAVIMPRFEPAAWLRTVQAHKITHSSLAPTMLRMVLSEREIDSTDTASVKLIAYGASPISPALLQAGLDRFGHVFVGTYGQTESSGNVLALSVEDHRRALEEPWLLTAAGRCESLAAVRIVDDDMRDVPVGEAGEIVVRGDQVMQGYWRNPEATADTVIDGWLRTGDVARTDDEGFVFILDRKKDMVVSGGENVFPREVEDVISDLEGVREVAVIGVPHELWGEQVVAVVCRAAGFDLDEESVIAHCRAALAGYKVPKRVDFREELPKNASLKTLKRVLRDEYAVSAV